MKIETTIKPRKDGTVTTEFNGVNHVFAPDESGALVCDVADELQIAYLLGLADFYPADEADFAAAMQLTDDGDGDADDEDMEDEDEQEQDQNAAPIEEPASQVAAAAAGPRVAKARTPRKAK